MGSAPTVILGAGLSGLSVARALLRERPRAPIVLVDRRTSWERDRTWCFWATPGLPDAVLATARWTRWQTVGPSGAVEQHSERHPYLHLPADRFYEASLAELSSDFYVDHRISREEFFAARAGLEKRLEGNRLRLARRDGRGVLAGFVGEGGTLRRAWESGSLDWRRAVVGALLDRVVIEPGKAGRNAVDPQRVKPIWRY